MRKLNQIARTAGSGGTPGGGGGRAAEVAAGEGDLRGEGQEAGGRHPGDGGPEQQAVQGALTCRPRAV